MATPDLDLQGLWETTLREVALEGSNGCTLERLWKLVGLVGRGGLGEKEGESGQATENDPQEFVRAWLWRSIVARRGKELALATFNDQGESNNLRRGDPEDSRLAAIKDMPTLQKEQGSVGVVASRPLRLRALGLDTATLKSVTLVVARYRGWGASAAEVLDGVNRIISSNKKDDYLEVVASQGTKYRAANKMRDGGFLGSEVMTEKQLYPVYDRLASTGLIFKSSVQKTATGHEQDGRASAEQEEGIYRFVVLYLTRFKDAILLPPDTKLEPTAKEVFLEMLVDHLLEAGGSGAVVPWYNVRKDLFLDKNASGRLRNFLQKESARPGFPIRIQLLDVRAVDYVNTRRGRRLEWCVSLKHSSELEPHALKRPHGISLVRSIMAIIKSRGEEGANADLVQRLLHCSKKPLVTILDFMVKNSSSYGIWRGYTREGRSARVQNLFYSEELLGRGNAGGSAAAPPSLPSAVKTDLISSSTPFPLASAAANPPNMAPPPLQDTACMAAQPPSASTASLAACGGLGGSGVPVVGVGSGSADGGGVGGGEGGGKGVGDGGGGLGDVNWSDDDALDAMVDDIGREVDEAQAKLIDKRTEARVKFEMNPVFPPEDCPVAVRSAWMQMTPKDRRKNFVLYELEQCWTIPMLKLLQLIKMQEGPGPALQRATLETVVNELVQEGRVQRSTAPPPMLGAGRCSLKVFGNGDMVLHADAKTDAKSMATYAENFYALEEAVHRETTRIRSKEHSGYSWNAWNSPERFLVYKRKMHRSMILHRELLRCLPKRPGHRVGSRAIDLDRVILDTPLSTFLTMFGYPPDNLHTQEMYTVLKKAEVRKATIRQSPVAIWELMRTVPWYKEALTSSLKILHEMRVLTATDPPPPATATATATSRGNPKEASSSASSSSSSSSSPPPSQGDRFAYLHDTAKDIQPMSTGAESAAAIDKFHKDMAAAAAARREQIKHAEESPPANQYGVNPFARSARGLRRDKKARSAAAEALLREKSPPGEMRMGLGWAVLHVDLVVFTEDSRKSLPKRVTQHLGWSNFWSTYQFFATGQRTADLAKEDGLARENLGIPDDVALVPHPLASWLLEKVPYLADAKEWGVDGNETEDLNRWHRAKALWTEEQDMMLIMAVKRCEPEPTYANSKPKPSGPGRPDRNVYKLALKPVAERLGKSPDAAWRRYKNLAEAYNKHAPLGQELPLPAHNRQCRKRSADEVDDETSRANKRRGRRTGMLRSEGENDFRKNFGHLQFQASDLNEGRMKAREEAAMAKAAGFEWANEEGSWDEDGRGGGYLPRPFDRWGWTMEELAAFTAVRQLLLVPEGLFDPNRALERMQAFRPPTLQKAYRSLLAMEQIDISKSAWAANDHSVHDSVDHEVYKMIGRHGTNLVSRGVTAAGSMHALGIADKWTSPLPAFQEETADSAVNPLALQLKVLCSPPPTNGPGGACLLSGHPAALPVAAIGRDRNMMAKLLEAVVRGWTKFAVKPPPAGLSTTEGVMLPATGVGIAARTGGGGSGSGTGTATGAFAAGRAPAPSPAGADVSAPSRVGTASVTTPRGDGVASSADGASASQAGSPAGGGGGGGGEEGLPSGRSTAEATGSVGGGGDNAKKGGSSSAGGGQQQQEGGVVCTTSRYRSSKSIDGDIMATVLAEAMPRGGGGGGGVDAGEDGRDVYGPEMDWGLATLGSGGGVEEDRVGDGSAGSCAATVVLEALKSAKEEGMRLPELRRVAFRAASAADAEYGANLLAVVGRVLRNSAVVCVCDAEDVRYMHGDSCGLWTVPPPTAGVESAPASFALHTEARPPTSTPMDLEEEQEEGEEEAPNSGGTQSRNIKGKGKRRVGTTTAPSGSSILSAKGDPKPKIMFPWMSLTGEVNLRLLNRTRQALVAYVRSNPGCQAADVREVELSFLTGGETMLLLRDLVRRKVLREHTVPDASAGTLAGGWGLSQRGGGGWALACVGGVLDQQVPTAATTSFTLAFDWQAQLSRIEGILPC
eukprot:g9353.t1